MGEQRTPSKAEALAELARAKFKADVAVAALAAIESGGLSENDTRGILQDMIAPSPEAKIIKKG